MFLASLLLGAALIATLQSCSSSGKKWNPDDYTVKSGDTIYSIAWRYELDPEAFASWNGISLSKFIKPGQRLHTRKPANFDANKIASRNQSVAYAPASTVSTNNTNKNRGKTNRSNPGWVKAKKGDTLYALSRRYDVSVDRLAGLNQLKKPYVIKPGQTIFLKPLNTGKPATSKTRTAGSVKSGNTKSQYTHSTAQAISWPRTVRWQRPAKGKIVKKFNRNRNDAKGIGVAGKKGSAIVAAASGKVVYSGNGLISYGNLIIIKHNKTFLSAYAYNRKLLVKEGEVVKAGQQIAEMGNKDKTKTLLHFEIRKNGKPVDPLKYLPWE